MPTPTPPFSIHRRWLGAGLLFAACGCCLLALAPGRGGAQPDWVPAEPGVNGNEAAGGSGRTPPGRHTPAAVAWGAAVSERPLVTLAGPEMIRYYLTPGDAYVYFVRAEYGLDAPSQPSSDNEPSMQNRPQAAADMNPRSRVPVVPLPLVPQRRTLCRVPIVPADAPNAGDVAVEEVAELGGYPFGFVILDGGERVVCVVQPEPAEGEAAEGEAAGTAAAARGAPARIVRLGEHTEAGWRWRNIYVGSPEMVLAQALPRRNEVLVVEPGADRFDNRIMRLSLRGPRDEAEAWPPPVEWTYGLYPAAVDENERYLVVTRAGEHPGYQGPGRQPVERPELVDPDVRLTYPPTVVTVSLDDAEAERLLVERRDFVHARFVHDDIAYADLVEYFPHASRHPSAHPALQARHTLVYFDLGGDESPTRVPMSDGSGFDFQLIGPLPTRGILYLRNTNINRYLGLHTGDNRTIQLREFSALTAEFVLSADRRWLYFLEYAEVARAPYNPMTRPTRIRALELAGER